MHAVELSIADSPDAPLSGMPLSNNRHAERPVI